MLEKIAGVCLVEKLQAIQLYEADFNCYNQFIFGCQVMQALTISGYVPEELFSQKGSTAEDAKFDKTLMADLSRQARHPMTIVSADTAYCYDKVNHVIVSLVWLVLTNGNIPAIIASLVCLQTMKLFQRTGFGESKTFFGGKGFFPYMMGLGQGNRAAPPSWIQLSAVLIQATQVGSSDSGPYHGGTHPHNGSTLCGQHRSIHMETAHHGSQRNLGPNTNRA
jgi:hypothetical protein